MITGYAAVGFDPAVSSLFYVFQIVQVYYDTQPYLVAVEIYSSETGAWILTEQNECIFRLLHASHDLLQWLATSHERLRRSGVGGQQGSVMEDHPCAGP